MHEEGKQRKRLTKNIFFSSSWLSHTTSFTSFSPPLVSLRQTSNTIFFSSVCSCQFNLDGCTCRHRLRLIRLEYTWSKKHLHSPPHTQLHSVSCTPWHKYTLFHFKKSWLQGCSHVFLYIVCSLTLSVSVHPSPPGTLDYISACVRPGDVFTQIISFISCASIHPAMCPFTPSISLSLYRLISARREECATTAAYLLISHLDLSILPDSFFCTNVIHTSVWHLNRWIFG